MQEFTKQQIAKAINRPIRTIKYWTDQGIVKPEGKPARGRGHVRTYTAENLVGFAMADFMSADMGLPLYVFRNAVSGMEGFLDPEYGVKYDIVFCQEVRTIVGDMPSRWFCAFIRGGPLAGGGQIKTLKGSFGKQTTEKIYFEKDFGYSEAEKIPDLFELVGKWVFGNKISGYTMLRLGDIRNKAIHKHGIDLLAIG